MAAAKAWGLIPSQWDACGVHDRARMLAHELISGIHSAYDAHLAKLRGEAQAKAQASGKSNPEAGPPNAFTAMKQRFNMGRG